MYRTFNVNMVVEIAVTKKVKVKASCGRHAAEQEALWRTQHSVKRLCRNSDYTSFKALNRTIVVNSEMILEGK